MESVDSVLNVANDIKQGPRTNYGISVMHFYVLLFPHSFWWFLP
jgi:hypothetical protein